MKVEINALYCAPQGEGVALGRPSLFVRVRRCVLHCSWCDSQQTWNPADPEYEQYDAHESTDTLVQAMLTVAGEQPFFPWGLVLTGGEPLIYQDVWPGVIDAYRQAAEELHGTEVDVEVETAGTIAPTGAMQKRCSFNVSPKLFSSGNDDIPLTTLWNAKAISVYITHRRSIFKIVVGEHDRHDLHAWLDFLYATASPYMISPSELRKRVYLMPCAATRDELPQAQRLAMELAEGFGVGVTTRMQITAWNSERRR